SVSDKVGAPYEPPADGPLRVLVIGGSQGARILSTRIAPALAALPEALRSRLSVAHQARAEDAAAVTGIYAAASIDAEVSPFFADVPERLAACQLVISRSGASSVADISAIGRPALLIPYAVATNDHQTANAKGLVSSGGAELLPEAQLNIPAAASRIEAILTDPQKALSMAEAARQQGRPDAANRLADLVESLAKRQKQKGQ
ncbi:MAG: glycosyltransferase, partial [Pseudomonadota bacterium]